MGDTNIEWAERVWNPLAGCTRVSPGCQHCYAERMAKRLIAMGQSAYSGTVSNNGRWTGKINLIPEKLREPLERRKASVYFVNSMSDLFHENVPDEYIAKVFAVMAVASSHRFIVLTKRSKRMREFVSALHGGWGTIFDAVAEISGTVVAMGMASRGLPKFENVILGVSVEDHARANERIPDLLATPAACRCISAEPLLGPVDIAQWLKCESCLVPAVHWCGDARVDWVIAGGESGPEARPMHPDWARVLRDQCVDAGVAFFFKQWGEWAPGECVAKTPTRTEHTASWWREEWLFDTVTPKQSEFMHVDDEPDLYRCGKHAAGRLLDGVE